MLSTIDRCTGIFNTTGASLASGIYSDFSPFNFSPLLYLDAGKEVLRTGAQAAENLNYVAAWKNLGSGASNAAQSTSLNQPRYHTPCEVNTVTHASLDLDPSVPSSLDIITATRASTATVTDASGNIVNAAPNTVRVDHVQGELITAARTNLMGYSEPTLAQYSSGSGSGISEVVVADSGLTQWTQWDDTTGLTRDVTKSGFPFVVGQPYILSFYIRMNDGGIPVVGNSSSGASTDFAILIQGDSYAGTGYNGGIENVGSGLYRVWGKKTATVTSGNFHISKYSNQSDRGFRVSGLQVEQAEAPTALIDNDTGGQITEPAVYGPRVPMILVEPSATNLVPSKVFFGVGTTTIASGFLAPDGSMDACELSNILDNSSDRVYCAAATVSGSTEYTGSLYVKGTAGEVATIQAKRSGAGAYSASTTSVVTLTGSWQRVTGLTFTTAADNTQAVVSVRNEAAATADTIQVWGAQLELGPVSTSFIKTTSGAVTRASDDLVISGSDFTDFYNQSEGAFYVESELQRETEVGSGFQPFLFDADNGDANRVVLYNASGGDVLGLIKAVGAGYTINLGPHPSVNTFSRTAFSYKANNLGGSKDGNSVTPLTTAVIPTTINKLNVGSHYTKAESLYFNGHIKRLIYWPYHSSSLSATFLTDITGANSAATLTGMIENPTVICSSGHLYLSGYGANYAQMAYSPSISESEDFSITVKADPVYPSTTGDSTAFFGNGSGFLLRLKPNSFFEARLGVGHNLLSNLTGYSGGVAWFRARRTSGTLYIEWSPDGVTYTVIGSLAHSVSPTNNVGADSYIGSFGPNDSDDRFQGGILRVTVNVAGVDEVDIDFSKAPHAATTFTPTVGGTVTINQAGNDPATIVRRPFLRFDGVNSRMSGLFNTTITGGTFFMVARGRTQSTNGYYFYTTKSGEDGVNWRYTPTSGTLRSYYQESVELEHSAANSGIGHLLTHTKLTDVGEASLNGQFLTDATNPEVNSEAYTIGISQSVAADVEHMSFFPVGSGINTRVMLNYLKEQCATTTRVHPPSTNPTYELITTGESIVAIKTRSLVQGTDGKLYGAPYSGSFDQLLRIDPVTGAVDYSQSTAGISTNGSKWIAGFKLNDGRTFHNAHGATAGNLIVDASTNPPTLSAMGQTFYQGNPVGGQHRGGLQASNGFIYQSNYTAAKGFSKLDPADGLYKTSPVYAVIDTGPLYSSNLPLAESSQHYRQWGLCEDPVSGIIFGTPVGGDRIVYHNPSSNVTVQGADLLTGNVPPPTSTSSDYFMKYTGDGIYSPISQRIYCFPRRANAILVINPADQSAIEIPTPDELNDPVLQKSFAAVMGGDGCIYSVPWGVPYLFRINPRNHEIRTWYIQDIFTAAGGQLGVGWWTAGIAVGNDIWYAPGGANYVLKVTLPYNSKFGSDSGFDPSFDLSFK
jgi:hypothetical protein